MKTGIIIGVIIIVGIIYFISKGKNNPSGETSKQIKLDELESVVTQLLDKKLDHDFFGITSNGIDCIYFVDNNGKINIEFEVMTNEQKPYVEEITDFTNKNNYTLVKTTYGNKPRYVDTDEAPVYLIELNADKKKATEVGIEIMTKIFFRNKTTIFDVVP